MDLSVIILSYKSKEYLRELLPSVFASTKKYTYEVIVVDNDSEDGTAEAVETLLPVIPNLKLIRNENNGFAAGNNLGISKSSGRYILILNPDTKVERDTFEIMLDMMENRSKVGISGCKIVRPNGKLDLACRRRFPDPWVSFKRLFLLSNISYNYADIDENMELEVDSVVGAFLLIRRSVIDKIGLLDESFFMYGEDLDWCWRCKDAGYKVWYYPRTSIIHYKGSSSAKVLNRSLRWFHEAMWIFYKKHYSKKYSKIFSFIVLLGIWFRFYILYFMNVSKKLTGRK